MTEINIILLVLIRLFLVKIILKNAYKLSDERKVTDEIQHRLSSILFSTCTVISLKLFYDTLMKLVISVRNSLVPTLINQINSKRIGIRLKKATNNLAKANGLYFQHLRVWAELNFDLIRNFHAVDIRDLKRKKYKGESNSPLLLDDIFNSITKIKDYCEEQLNIIKNSYHDFLTSKVIISNYRLQILIVILSLVIVLITLYSAIPDHYLKLVFGRIYDVFK